jgi:hypothetical protein
MDFVHLPKDFFWNSIRFLGSALQPAWRPPQPTVAGSDWGPVSALAATN